MSAICVYCYINKYHTIITTEMESIVALYTCSYYLTSLHNYLPTAFFQRGKILMDYHGYTSLKEIMTDKG